jgi:hypothetical protein
VRTPRAGWASVPAALWFRPRAGTPAPLKLDRHSPGNRNQSDSARAEARGPNRFHFPATRANMQSAMEDGITAARRPRFSSTPPLAGSSALRRLTNAVLTVTRPYRRIWETFAQPRRARIEKSEYSERAGERGGARRTRFKRSQSMYRQCVSIRAEFYRRQPVWRWLRRGVAEPIEDLLPARANLAGRPRRWSRYRRVRTNSIIACAVSPGLSSGT